MKKDIQSWIDSNQNKFIEISKKLWENPEASEKEYFACHVLKEVLSESDFSIKEDVAGLETAFEAKWGKGRPYIGFLAEYDALPGLSQDTVPFKREIEGKPYGHGCGHNLLGTGAVAAAIALKNRVEQEKLSGTVFLYGCPSEEIMMGKIIMTKEHVFDDLDVAISWHPGDLCRSSEESYQAMMSMIYYFTGKSSHAAMAPQEGFSALDAVELMDVGINYLREHIPEGGQMHYTILNGGDKPNIVPEKASVWQFARANTTIDLRFITERMDEVAKGAAIMTGTTVEKKVLTGCNETRIVPELVRIMNNVMESEVPAIVWSEKEKEFSRKLIESLDLNQISLKEKYGADVLNKPLHDDIIKITGKTIDILGSSDISDVSYVVPTCMLFSACYPKGIPNHTWAVTACAGNSIGQKGMLYAAKVMAVTGYHLLTDNDSLIKVKKSFEEIMDGIDYQPVA